MRVDQRQRRQERGHEGHYRPGERDRDRQNDRRDSHHHITKIRLRPNDFRGHRGGVAG